MTVKCGDRIIFEEGGSTHKGWVLWLNDNGTVQVSENKTIETMGLAQNWIISKLQIKSVV